MYANNPMWKYGVVIAFLLISFSVLKLVGNPNELILLKMAVVPIFFLAVNGLRVSYGQSVSEEEFTARAIEYFLLKGLIFSLLLFVFLWQPGVTLKDLFGLFFVSLVAFSVAMLVKAYFAVKVTARNQ